MKRTIALLLSLVTLLSVFSSCGSGGSETEYISENGNNQGKDTEDMTGKENIGNFPEPERIRDLEYLNSQSHRPFIHFSCEINGMNDPNGLWYDETTGLYHLYFQYDPRGLTVASQCVWGHAVSYDLMNWAELEPALTCQPEMKRAGLNVVASGSCVVDEDNTSGFFDESVDPKQRVVALYSNLGAGKQQTQSVAYSLDGGYSFIHYENNPVISSGVDEELDFRDPKVIKYYDESYENGYIWVMIVAGGIVQFYTSENLKDWTFNSALRNPYRDNEYVRSECPDIFPLSEKENPENVKWVFTHSGSYYMTGELKKNEKGLFEFFPDHDLRRFNTPNTGAFQSFYNTADGRRIGLSWQADFSAGYEKGFENKPWNGCLTLPMELELRRDRTGTLRLYAEPVKEAELLRGEELVSLKDVNINSKSENLLSGVKSKNFELETVIDCSELKYAGLKLRSGETQFIEIRFQKYSDTEGKLICDFSRSSDLMIPAEPLYEQPLTIREDGTVSLRIYCDGMSFELYANDGENIVENIIFPEDSSLEAELFAGSPTLIKTLKVWQLDSIFKDREGHSSEGGDTDTDKGTDGTELVDRYESPVLPENTLFCEMDIHNVYEDRGIPANTSSLVDAWASGKEGIDRGLTFTLKSEYSNKFGVAVNKSGKGDFWILGGGEKINIAKSEDVYIYNGKPSDGDFGKKINGNIKDVFGGCLGISGPYVWLGNLWAFKEEQKVPEGYYTFVLYGKNKESAVAFTEYVVPSFMDHAFDYSFK